MAIRRFQSDPHKVGPLSLRVRGAVDDSDLGEDDQIVGYLPRPHVVDQQPPGSREVLPGVFVTEPIGPFSIENEGVTGLPPVGHAMVVPEGVVYTGIDLAAPWGDQTVIEVFEVDLQFTMHRVTGEDGRPVIDVEEVPRDQKALPPKGCP